MHWFWLLENVSKFKLLFILLWLHRNFCVFSNEWMLAFGGIRRWRKWEYPEKATYLGGGLLPCQMQAPGIKAGLQGWQTRDICLGYPGPGSKMCWRDGKQCRLRSNCFSSLIWAYTVCSGKLVPIFRIKLNMVYFNIFHFSLKHTGRMANNVDPDQTVLGLHCLLRQPCYNIWN